MADTVQLDTSSWREVQITAGFTAVTSIVLLLIFEVARRFKSIVYDRRRRLNLRTIPPLLPKLFEWLFVSTDETYTEFATLRHEHVVLQERQRQREYYTRMLQEVPNKNETKKKKRNKHKTKHPVEASDEEQAGYVKTASEDDEDDDVEEEIFLSRDLEEQAAGEEQTTPEEQNTNTSKTKVNLDLTPDIVICNGRRLPVRVLQEVNIWDLTDDELRTYEEQLIAEEMERERIFQERLSNILVEQSARRNQKKKDNNNLDDAPLDVARLVAPPRWRYVGFASHQRPPSGALDSVRVAGTRGLVGPQSLSMIRSAMSDSDDENKSVDSVEEEYKVKNQYLKSVSDKVTRPLSTSDQKLLDIIGLDAFVMVRFLRFGFDTSFYPFLIATVMLIPTYFTNDFEGEDGRDTSGYFRFTMDRLELNSRRLWVPWTFAVLFFGFILYRLHIEWETFISLRSDFLANGDAYINSDFIMPTLTGADEKRQQAFTKHTAQTSLIQYRNSCVVEYIPESHQTDQSLFDFFDAIFPKQVERAEILMKADVITKLIAKRQKLIEQYENIYARYFHVHQKHRRTVRRIEANQGTWSHWLVCRPCRGMPKQPVEPTIRKSGRCCWKKMEKLLPHIRAKIELLNEEIDEEHARITKVKKQADETAQKRNILSRAVGKGLQYVKGQEQYICSTGFVQFKNLSTKQNALQCTISGTTRFMTTDSAPDPRDIDWANAGEAQNSIVLKLYKCRALLFTGTLFWFFVVSFVTSISDLERVSKYVPSKWIPDEDTYWYSLIQGYLPVVALEVIMYFVPILLRILAQKYIRVKTKSDVDRFVFGWHFAYRLANLVIIIVKNEVLQQLTLDDVRNDVRGSFEKVAMGVAQSSQFFMNYIIAAAGTETLWELAQVPNIIIHFFTYRVVTVEAKSKRALEKLEEPMRFEWGSVFPTFIFAFLVATVYAATVPLILGVCAIFFYLTTKVYTHQALYVYVQPYEGGGKLMYLLNRTLFTILYFSIAIFGMLLALKEGRIQAPTFFFPMILIAIYCDWRIHTKFVVPSLAVNLTNARIIDNEEKVRQRQVKKRRRRNDEDYDEYIFRQPQLNKLLWETKPRPYR